jgi:hypothetical protein
LRHDQWRDRSPVGLPSLPQKWEAQFSHLQQKKIPRVRIRRRGIPAERYTMKILNYVSGKLIMVAIACSFAASTPIQARGTKSNSASAHSEDDARLVVTREANFGTFEFLNLFVDGVHVADLGLNQSYDADLPPGRHVLSVTTTPQAYGYEPPTYRRVNARPGTTYAFTAFWKNSDQAYLERNGRSNRVVTRSLPEG